MYQRIQDEHTHQRGCGVCSDVGRPRRTRVHELRQSERQTLRHASQAALQACVRHLATVAVREIHIDDVVQ